MYRNIVVGYNDGEDGGDALALAAHLRAPDGTVTAACVYSDPGPARGAEWNATMRAAATETLERAVADMDGAPWLRTQAPPGHSAAHGLHHLAEESGADLIVVGSSHRGTIGRTLAGSVAKGLLNGSSCPVAVAPKGYRDSGPGPSTIGVAYDGSQEAAAALREALGLADATGAQLKILCAIAPIEVWAGSAAWYGGYSDEELRRYRDIELHRMLDDSPEPLADDLRGRLHVIDGRPADALLGESKRLDLLVMGSRGYGPLRRVLLGSTAAAVIEEASCPVLVVPRAAAAGAEGELDATGHAVA